MFMSQEFIGRRGRRRPSPPVNAMAAAAAASSATSLSNIAGVLCNYCPPSPTSSSHLADLEFGRSSSPPRLSASSTSSITSGHHHHHHHVQPRWVAATTTTTTAKATTARTSSSYREMMQMMRMSDSAARRPTASSSPSSPLSSSTTSSSSSSASTLPSSDEDYFYEQQGGGGSHQSIVSDMAAAQSTSTAIEITYILNGKISTASGQRRPHRGGTGPQQQQQQQQLALQPQWALVGDCSLSPTPTTTTPTGSDVLVECIKITPVNGFVCFIGLDRATCDLVLKPFPTTAGSDNNSNLIEGRQVVLVYANGSFHLKDLNSSLGTFINEHRVPSRCFVPLAECDTIRFGFTPSVYRLVKLAAHPQHRLQGGGGGGKHSKHLAGEHSAPETSRQQSNMFAARTKVMRPDKLTEAAAAPLSPSNSSLLSSSTSSSSSTASSPSTTTASSLITSPSKVFRSAMKQMRKLKFKRKTSTASAKDKSMICSGNEDITFIRYDNHTADTAGPVAPAATAPMIKVKMSTSFKAPPLPYRGGDDDHRPLAMMMTTTSTTTTMMEPEDCEEEEVLSIYNVPITADKVENDYDEVTREDDVDDDDEQVLVNSFEPTDMVQQANKGKATPDSNFDSLAGKSITTTTVEGEEDDEEEDEDDEEELMPDEDMLETKHSSREVEERSLEEISSTTTSSTSSLVLLSTVSSEHCRLVATTTSSTTPFGQSLNSSPPPPPPSSPPPAQHHQHQVGLDLSASLKGHLPQCPATFPVCCPLTEEVEQQQPQQTVATAAAFPRSLTFLSIKSSNQSTTTTTFTSSPSSLCAHQDSVVVGVGSDVVVGGDDQQHSQQQSPPPKANRASGCHNNIDTITTGELNRRRSYCIEDKSGTSVHLATVPTPAAASSSSSSPPPLPTTPTSNNSEEAPVQISGSGVVATIITTAKTVDIVPGGEVVHCRHAHSLGGGDAAAAASGLIEVDDIGLRLQPDIDNSTLHQEEEEEAAAASSQSLTLSSVAGTAAAAAGGVAQSSPPQSSACAFFIDMIKGESIDMEMASNNNNNHHHHHSLEPHLHHHHHHHHHHFEPANTDSSLEPLSIESQSKRSVGGMSFVIDLDDEPTTAAAPPQFKSKLREKPPSSSSFLNRRHSFNTKAPRNGSACTDDDNASVPGGGGSAQANSFLRHQDNHYRRSLRVTSARTNFVEKERTGERGAARLTLGAATTTTTTAPTSRSSTLKTSNVEEDNHLISNARRYHLNNNNNNNEAIKSSTVITAYSNNDDDNDLYSRRAATAAADCLWTNHNNNSAAVMKRTRKNKNSVDTSDTSSKGSSTSSSIRHSTAHLSESAVYLINRMFEDNDRHHYAPETIVEADQFDGVVCCARGGTAAAADLAEQTSAHHHLGDHDDGTEHSNEDVPDDISETGTYTIELDDEGQQHKKSTKTNKSNKDETGGVMSSNKVALKQQQSTDEDAVPTDFEDEEETGYEVDEEEAEADDDETDSEEVEDKLEVARKRIDELFSVYEKNSAAEDLYQGANNATFTRTKKGDSLSQEVYHHDDDETSGDELDARRNAFGTNHPTIRRQGRDDHTITTKPTDRRKVMSAELVNAFKDIDRKLEKTSRLGLSYLASSSNINNNKGNNITQRGGVTASAAAINKPKAVANPSTQSTKWAKSISAPSTPYMSGSDNRKQYRATPSRQPTSVLGCFNNNNKPASLSSSRPTVSSMRKSSISSTDDRYTSVEDFDDKSSAISTDTFAAGRVATRDRTESVDSTASKQSGLMKFNRAFALRRARLGMDTCGVELGTTTPKEANSPKKTVVSSNNNSALKRNDGGRFSLRVTSAGRQQLQDQQRAKATTKKPTVTSTPTKNKTTTVLTNSQRTIRPVENLSPQHRHAMSTTSSSNSQRGGVAASRAGHSQKAMIHSDNEVQHLNMLDESSCDELSTATRNSSPLLSRFGRSSLRATSSSPWLKANTRHTPLVLARDQQQHSSLGNNAAATMQKSSSFTTSSGGGGRSGYQGGRGQQSAGSYQHQYHESQLGDSMAPSSSDCGGHVRSLPSFQMGKRFFSTKPHQKAQFDRDFHRGGGGGSCSVSQSRAASRTPPEPNTMSSLMTHSVTESMLMHHQHQQYHSRRGSTTTSASSHDMMPTTPGTSSAAAAAGIGSMLSNPSPLASAGINSRIFTISPLDSLVISAINQLSGKLRTRLIELLEGERSNHSIGSETRSLIEEILPQVACSMSGLDYRGAQSKGAYNHEPSNLSRDLSNILKNLKKVEQIFDVFHLLLEPSTSNAAAVSTNNRMPTTSDSGDNGDLNTAAAATRSMVVGNTHRTSLTASPINRFHKPSAAAATNFATSTSSSSSGQPNSGTGFFIEL